MAKPIYLSEAEHKLVSDAVARAEEATAGEVVTIVADRSDGYTDVALAWASFAALASLGVMALLPDPFLDLYDRLTGSWNSDWTPRMVLGLAAGFAAMKFAGVFLIQLIQPVKFLLVPPPVKTARVHARAIGFFKTSAERRTSGRTGVLIYLSMREHRAEILADEAIASQVSPEVWGDAMAAMLAHIRAGRVAEGMASAVEKVGEVLAQHCPRLEDDRNELPDRLIEI